ncbi:MAG: hypothetical protein P8074_01150 [Anaerolineales bacterium]|jgi:hypothetical protein
MSSKRFSFRKWSVPLALLALCALSFGLLIPWLGFYWDDWPVILMTRLQGAAGFIRFYQYDRPFSAWTYLITAPILGTSPLPWHIFTLLLRWITVVGMWWSLRGLWPRRTREVTWMAFLFAIYPVFTQQPTSVAYSQHWTVFALFFLSLGAMIQSLRTPRWYWPLTALAVTAALVHLLTMEYFLGLELLRPLILWLMLGEREIDARQRLKATLKYWLPYILVLLVFVVYRLFFLTLAGEDPNNPELLFALFSQPIQAALRLVEAAIQDSLYILITSWYQTIQPSQISLTDRFLLVSEVIAFLGAVAVLVFLLRFKSGPQEETPSEEKVNDRWALQAMALGLLAVVLGPLPVWLTGKQVILGLYGNRFGLASMFGASIFLVALLEWFTPRRLAKAITLSVLVGLAIGFHLRNANEYRWIWTKQTRFYWQLHWRAPDLQPKTAILSEGELFKYVGYYSTSMGLNLMYPHPPSGAEMNYWFVDLYRNYQRNRSGLAKGIPIKRDFRSFNFSGQSTDSLVIRYEPEQGSCLWVLGPNDADNPILSETIIEVLPASNFDLISAQPVDGYPPTDIFGPEPEHTWCYYYQKAELARQMGDWEQIVSLGQQAQQQGHGANEIQEWLPFIEGYAMAGELQPALDLTDQVRRVDPALEPRLCHLWQRVEDQSQATPQLQETLDQVRGELECAPQANP